MHMRMREELASLDEKSTSAVLNQHQVHQHITIRQSTEEQTWHSICVAPLDMVFIVIASGMLDGILFNWKFHYTAVEHY